MTGKKESKKVDTEAQDSVTLSKVVYFDEGSATDLIQIFHGGGLDKTLALFETDGEDGAAQVKADGKVGLGKILQGIIGIGASVEGGASMSTTYSSSQMAKNILTNTVLTDFLTCVNEGENGVKRLEGYELSTIDNAMSSMMLITPYLTMLRSGQGVRAGDFNISLERIDDAISKAKGYYEFLAVKNDEDPIILRFNHSSLKNNYKLPDLLKMKLMFYAVHVGATSPEALDIEKEINFASFDSSKNPSYPVEFCSKEESGSESVADQRTKTYEMFDVILAGVKGDA